jgi:hypothetical protein
MSTITDYLDWRLKADVGCTFARLMASKGKRSSYGQHAEALRAKTIATLAKRIDSRVTTHINLPATRLVTLVLPDVKHLPSVLVLAQELGKLPKWTVTPRQLEKTSKNASCVAISLARQIPFGLAECPSEALILGPFPEFPKTRRSPVTALEIFVGEPRPTDPKTGLPTTKANLAHIEVSLPTQEAFDNMWHQSKRGRRTSLGINLGTEVDEVPKPLDDLRAKAKVTFAVPSGIARTHGFKP